MRRDYPNGFLRALRHAARRSELEAELLDAADEIERLRGHLRGIERLRGTLRGIEIYATDTLSGPVRGPDDRKWYRDGIIEIVKRVRAARAGKENP